MMRLPAGYMNVFVEGDVIALEKNPVDDFPVGTTNIDSIQSVQQAYLRISDLYSENADNHLHVL